MQNRALVTNLRKMGDVASVVDEMSKAVVLRDYHERQADETLRRQKVDLQSFAAYLADANIGCGDLMNDLSAWDGISMGYVEGYKRWLLDGGYSIGTINVRLATIKRYVELAVKGGHVPQQSLAMIRLVKGYRPSEAIHVDQKRATTRQEGSKKAKHTLVSIEQAEALKKQDDVRDRLLMCLLVDHGFRCGEISALRIGGINMHTRQIVVYRSKVNKEGTQNMSVDTYNALEAYMVERLSQSDAKDDNYLFAGDVTREGKEGSYGVRAINKRVGVLGRELGIENLSPHDLRHFWAWYAAYRGIPINRLRQAGGWKSLEMPDRYIGNSEVENEGMV